MNSPYIHKNSCRICGSKNLTKFLDLSKQPLANAFLENKDDFKAEKKYPLAVYFCHDCNLAQLLDVIDKKILYRNYIYFTSGIISILLTANLSRDNHFFIYARDVLKRFLKKRDFVVEIASNDGAMLSVFQKQGCRVLGIDPAVNIAQVANQRGIETLAEFFDEKISRKIVRRYGQAKAIIANNVVAHIDDHHSLVRGIKELLAPQGIFIFEAPYLADMFENLTYDTIYHEHLSFLAVRPLKKLFEQFGLEFFDIEIQPVQGKSLRGFVCHQGVYPARPSVEQLVEGELKMGLEQLGTYLDLAERVKAQKNKLVAVLKDLKAKGKKISAYGAPAKGNTALNYCQIAPDLIDYAVDDLPIKQNRYTPGMRIPVVDRAYAAANPPDYYLMLAWNYADAILKKEKEFRKNGGKFIIPVEGVKIV